VQEGESDTDVSQLLNRTRQKKFVKNFKQLPSEELVLQRELSFTSLTIIIIIDHQSALSFIIIITRKSQSSSWPYQQHHHKQGHHHYQYRCITASGS